MSQNTQDWREEFEDEFVSFDGERIIDSWETVSGGKKISPPEQIKSFISNLLTSQFNSLIEELEEIKKTIFIPYADSMFMNGWSKALSDAQTIIRGKMEKI